MRKAIAIDFDGCLCTDAHPAIGQPNWDVINRAKQEQRDGAGLIPWTCREGDLLQEAVDACRGWGLIFDAVNESLPDWIEAYGTRPRKVGATEYWDDKAVHMPETSNDPLTLEELREMDGEPVYLPQGFCWALVTQNQVAVLITFPDGTQCTAEVWYKWIGKAYRRKPKEGKP